MATDPTSEIEKATPTHNGAGVAAVAPCSLFVALMGQIEAMRDRARQYAEESEAEQNYEEGHRHRSVEGTLNELHRLGYFFKENDQAHRMTAPLKPNESPEPPAGQSLGAAPCLVTVERDLFEWLVEYTLDLRGEWEWKRNSTKRNDEEMARLDEHIFKALQIRESPNSQDNPHTE